MLSVRIIIVLLLSIMLPGCSFAVSDLLTSPTKNMAQNPVEVELIKTSYKFEGRLKAESPIKKIKAFRPALSSGWRVVEH